MGLQQYRRPRMVVQNPKASVYEATRAMEANHIGLIVVQERGHVVGVLTDRDIALRVVGFQLDPTETQLKDVMTELPATLPLEASEEDALELMRARHVRRIPLVENDNVVGVVTTDDLTLSETADRAKLAEVIRAQLAEPGELKPAGVVHPTNPARYTKRRDGGDERSERTAARARQTVTEAARRVQAATRLESPERALEALEIVVSGIIRRITPSEAKDLVAQLPSELQSRWLDLRAGPDKSVTRESILLELQSRLSLEEDRADATLLRVGSALRELVSEGEIEHVRGQLPEEFRDIFSSR